jgi:tetratricopeptide (TPR) repeat protein
MARSIAGVAYIYLGNPEEARRLLESSLEAARKERQLRVMAAAQTYLAHLSLQMGEFNSALVGFEEVAALYAETKEPALRARAMSSAGIVLLELERTPDASARLWQAIDLTRTATEVNTFAAAIGGLGASELAGNQPFRAVALLTCAIALYPGPFRTYLARLLPRLAAAKALLTAAGAEEAERQGRSMTLDQAITYARQAASP